ncbi:MAG: class I SAM-dependent methyltransferase, partial [Armatimonadetes bacterium]|nr:class I SAM-dependent methyltransferase [Armatimonadota bacterium]
MRPDEHQRMHAFEDHYWWFVGRKRIIATLLNSHLPPAAHRRLLDVGCGSGATLQTLLQFGDAYGLDPFASAISLSQARGLNHLIRGDAVRLPFEAGSFEVVTALDVIEHIADDSAAVHEMVRVLAPEGSLLLAVPAYQFLWSQHDIALSHYRRYTATGLRRLVEGAGLKVVRLTYCITFLLPFAIALRLGERLLPRRADPHCALIELPPSLNRACLRTLEWEAALLSRISLPAGVSV